jgi:hypothetical protein
VAQKWKMITSCKLREGTQAHERSSDKVLLQHKTQETGVKTSETMQPAHPEFHPHTHTGRPFLQNGLIIQTKVSKAQKFKLVT